MNTILVGEKELIPGKIVCVGRNYTEHIAELGNELPEEMVVFCKPNSAISTTLSAVHQEQLHYEAEICFVVEGGELAGVGCGLDLTKRELQSKLKAKGLPWERAKSFDGAALFSSFVSLAGSYDDLGIRLSINGELRQYGTINHMLYPPKKILSELKTFLTIDDGDVIMTGTPAGVGKIVAGDSFEAVITAGSTNLVSHCWQAR